ncbi:hypothetical protein FVEN_g61 [Fusarium venenatum]|nr:hypothetical protein FVEN_g61 [Fusarium venenatum]
MVRSFSVHDLKHFSIEQQLTIKLLQFQSHWTIVVWSDCGTSLSQSHRGPWKQIRDSHAGAVRFISWPLDFTNRQIRHIIKSTQEESVDAAEKDQEVARDPLEAGLSLLCDELGQNEDSTETMASNASPFHALNTVFLLLAVSEYQFLNLMEEKTENFGKDANHGIGEIQRIKKQVDAHLERLQDVLDVIKNRGGRGWSLVSQQPHSTPSPHSEEHSDEQIQRRESSLSTSYQPQHHREEASQHRNKKNGAKAKADDAAICLERKFEKLIRRAQAVSSGCQDEMEKLSNESVVREAQRGKEQAEAVAKVTFIAALFVPLAFTTSIFGMDLQQLNGSGADITTWIYVVVPVMIVSVVAWAVNGERITRVWQWIRRHIVHECKGLKGNENQKEPV